MDTKLKKILNFYDIFLISLGYVVGAGIYALLYLITKKSKNLTWLSFLIGGIISLLTGLSYAKLSEKINTNATEYDYFTKIISNKMKFIPAFLLFFSGCFICSTLLLSFSNIFCSRFTNNKYHFIVLLITLILCSVLNIINVKLTSNINNILAIFEIIILLLVILFGFKPLKIPKLNINFNYKNIFDGAFLTLFAFSGFNSIPRLSEETINEKKNIPKAIISSIIFIIVLYCLTSISTNNILGVEQTANSHNPISKVYGKIFGSKYEKITDIATLLSIFNTILLSILFVSRQIYGISKDFKELSIINKVNKKTETPINSIILVGTITVILSIFKNIEFNNYISNIFLFFIYILVNLSLIILYKNEKEDKWINYITPILGLISSIFIFLKTIFYNYL